MTLPNLTTTDVISVASVRSAIATFLATDLTSLVQTVFDYEPKDFTASPVVAVVSDGDLYSRRTYVERVKAVISLNILTFVLYEGTGWTPENCEDKLNEIKQLFWVSFFNNQQITVSSKTVSLDIDTKSSIVPANVGGADYRLEIQPIKAEVLNG